MTDDEVTRIKKVLRKIDTGMLFQNASWHLYGTDAKTSTLRFHCMVPDATTVEHKMIDLWGGWQSVNCSTSDEDIVKLAWEIITSIVKHEQGEWFRYDGKRLHPPHGGIA